MGTQQLAILICAMLLAHGGSAQDTVHVQAPVWLIGGLEFASASVSDGWTNIPNMDDPANAVTGTAVMMSDGTAADSLACGALVNGPALFGNIAVVYRGQCAFDIKALSAQSAGASALVIINNSPEPPISMGPGTNGASVTIPVIMITDEAGAMLRTAIDSGTVQIYIGPACALNNTACHDLRIHLGSTAHVVGRSVHYWLTVRNLLDVQAEDVTLTLDHPGIYTYGSSSEPPLNSAPGHLEWLIDSIPPNGQRVISVSLSLPQDAVLIGASFISHANVYTAQEDQDPTNNQNDLFHTILGSWDPNDMVARTSSGLSDVDYYLAQDQWVDYTIRFQNTGTAEALSVYITDTLSQLLDPATVELLGTSHPCGFFFPSADLLQFEFPGVVLPDSVNNEPESHGFVSFRVRPVASLVVGDTIRNAADIYFDFNPPVHTNTTELACEGSVGMNAAVRRPGLSVFPNPADDYAVVTLPSKAASGALCMFDALGRQQSIVTKPIGNGNVALLTNALPNGVYLLRSGDAQAFPCARLTVQH